MEKKSNIYFEELKDSVETFSTVPSFDEMKH